MDITVENIAPDGLSKYEYMFYNIRGFAFVLQYYSYCERPTKRHGWTSKERYNRVSARSSNINAESIKIPAAIIQQAKEQLINSITFSKH